jgi:hypothetical protein
VKAIHNYEVPVDGKAHSIPMPRRIVHVDCRSADCVEIWAMTGEGAQTVRTFRVFGTDQPLPDNAAYVGSTLAGRGGALAWHLFELLGDAS